MVLLGKPALCEPILGKKGSQEEGDTLHPHRHPETTGVTGKGDARKPIIRVFPSAPNSLFSTCSAVMEGVPSGISPFSAEGAGWTLQVRGAAGDRAGGMG